jgi:hypothetical protein
MKTKFFTILSVAILCATVSNAAVWRVSNVSGANADFTGITEALNSTMVQSGDTLYIEPSPVSYGSISVTKMLTIIGNGYFLTQNPETQSNTNNSTLSTVSFNNGSAGSSISGCVTGSINISTSNITIERNKIYSMSIAANISDIAIMRNYIECSNYSSTINIGNNVNNVLVSGNYIVNTYGLYYNRAISMSTTSSAIIENNVIYNGVTIYNSNFYNNILRDGTFTPVNSTYTNNVGNDNQFGTANGNQQYVDMDGVFEGSGSTDGKWQLKVGSPAIGTGTGGQDCGMFAGPYAYILSGIPAIPSIYEYLQIYNGPAQEIEVTFSVKSHN